AVLFYKTDAGNYGKMQVLSFGRKDDNPAEFYIRYTTYNPAGAALNASEFADLSGSRSQKGGRTNEGYFYFDDQRATTKNLGKKVFEVWKKDTNEYRQNNGFVWMVENDLLFMNPRFIRFYLIPNETSNNHFAETKTGSSSKIVWHHNTPNNSITNTLTLALKACVETTESVKEYILVQNGQRSFTARGLIVQQGNDCFNAFNKTVTLKTGENQFQLIAQSNAGELKSEVFTITYNPNATTSNALSNAKPQRRLALIIGNAAYPTAGLKNPVNDATDIATALRAMGFEVISATNTNRLKMNTAIDDFGTRLKNYDLGFFYYAGHGLQVKGENYLVPIDAVPKSQGEVEYECYPVGKILAKMEEAANQANIIVLDACRDNPLQRSWSRSTGSNGLANINAPQGTFIGFATSPGSTAADGTGRNGVYTGALLEHIRKPNLTVDQLFNAVNGTVKKLTNNLQIPWKASSMSEDLYLTK
ncbi:MAG TPA: caspase family protein, partial [Haliscomenobacter sp.]|nr:caspase family protein [Haliscomenobacter sp.]